MAGLMRSTDGGIGQRTASYAAGRPRRLAAMGRNGDTEIGHLTRGEVVVPRGLLRNPQLKANLADAFKRAGVPMDRYEVGGRGNSRNPRTGIREYWGVGPGGPGADSSAADAPGTAGGGDHAGGGGSASGSGSEGGDMAGTYGSFEDFIGVPDDDHLFGASDTTGTLDEGGFAFSTNTPDPGLGAHLASGLVSAAIPGGTLLNAAGLLTPEAFTRHPDEYSGPHEPSPGGDGGGGGSRVAASETVDEDEAKAWTGIYTPPPRTHLKYMQPRTEAPT